MPEFLHVNSEDTLKKLNSNNKDKLVKYYMDGCGHCDDLEPIWKLVESRIKKDHDDSNIIVVQLNANFMENADVPNVEGFPTISMIKGGKKIEHKGARTEEAIMDFFQKNSLLTSQSGGGKPRRKTKKKLKRSRKNKSRAKRKGGHANEPDVTGYDPVDPNELIDPGLDPEPYVQPQVEPPEEYYILEYDYGDFDGVKVFLDEPVEYDGGETKEEHEEGVDLTPQYIKNSFDNFIAKNIYLQKNGIVKKIKVKPLSLPGELSVLSYSQSSGKFIKYSLPYDNAGGGKRRTKRKNKRKRKSKKRKSKKNKRKSKRKRSKKGKGPVMSKAKSLMPAKKVQPKSAVFAEAKESDDNYEIARLNREGNRLLNNIRQPPSPWYDTDAAKLEFDQNKRLYERIIKDSPVAEKVDIPEIVAANTVNNSYYNPKTNDGRDDNFVVVSSRRRGRNTNRVVPITGGKRKKRRTHKNKKRRL